MTMNISLSNPEVKRLQELLQGDLCRLILEIAHTDHQSMREGLKPREEIEGDRPETRGAALVSLVLGLKIKPRDLSVRPRGLCFRSANGSAYSAFIAGIRIA